MHIQYTPVLTGVWCLEIKHDHSLLTNMTSENTPIFAYCDTVEALYINRDSHCHAGKLNG
jgi:hypothetical protein